MVSLRSLVTGAAFIVVPVLAALTPSQIADGLSRLTQQAQDLQGPAQSITIVNAPLIVIGQGPFPVLIKGFTEMVTTGTTLLSQSSGTAKITSDEDAALVYNAVHGFHRVTQQLLNILIGKAGILSNVPFIGPPVAASLRQLEGVVDSIFIFLIDTVETAAKNIESDANSLGDTLDVCIQKYEGIQLKKRAEVFVA